MRPWRLTGEIIGAAIEAHRHWGPGLYEEIYERSLCRELTLRDVPFENPLKLPVHEAQLLTYMKLLRCPVGLLINFNVPVLKDGIRRMVL